MIVKPLPVGDIVVCTSCLTANTPKSHIVLAFGTNHGVSVIFSNNFDW